MLNSLSESLKEFEEMLDYLKQQETHAPLQLRDISSLTRVRKELNTLSVG